MAVIRRFVAWLVVWTFGISIDFAVQSGDRAIELAEHLGQSQRAVVALKEALEGASAELARVRKLADCAAVKASRYEATLAAISGAKAVPLAYAAALADKALTENRAS